MTIFSSIYIKYLSKNILTNSGQIKIVSNFELLLPIIHSIITNHCNNCTILSYSLYKSVIISIYNINISVYTLLKSY